MKHDLKENDSNVNAIDDKKQKNVKNCSCKVREGISRGAYWQITSDTLLMRKTGYSKQCTP